MNQKDAETLAKRLFFIKKVIYKSLKKCCSVTFIKENRLEVSLKIFLEWKRNLLNEIPLVLGIPGFNDPIDTENKVSDKEIQGILLKKVVKETLESCTSNLKKLITKLQKAQELRDRNFKKVYPKKFKVIKVKKEKGQVKQDLMEMEFRKNRPGQRARREKWERKYGKDANHLKKAPGKSLKSNIVKTSQGRNRGKFVEKNSLPEKSLHPSWDAKKKEKEAREKLLKSRGKAVKIVFQED